MYLAFSYLGQISKSRTKYNPKTQDFKRVSDLNCKEKEE